MDLYLSKPIYCCKPIRSVAALARALKCSELELRSLAERAHKCYRTVPMEPGSTRQTFDARPSLKAVHRRIKEAFFSNVAFPDYLHGSLKGCDYVTNAALHANKQVLICEDVKKFFPSVRAANVQDVWCAFFGFSREVAELLTQLSTKDGGLPQGAIPSSYLANLVLWRDEPLLQAKFAARGITYSRYVDDIAMSSAAHLSTADQQWAIAQVFGMLRKNGLSAHRGKHQIFSASKQMIATKLIVNRKPSLSQQKRSQVRAQVKQLEIAQTNGIDPTIVRDLANKAAQQAGQLGRFHKTQAAHLKERIGAVRGALPMAGSHPIVTISKTSSQIQCVPGAIAGMPWE